MRGNRSPWPPRMAIRVIGKRDDCLPFHELDRQKGMSDWLGCRGIRSRPCSGLLSRRGGVTGKRRSRRRGREAEWFGEDDPFRMWGRRLPRFAVSVVVRSLGEDSAVGIAASVVSRPRPGPRPRPLPGRLQGGRHSPQWARSHSPAGSAHEQRAHRSPADVRRSARQFRCVQGAVGGGASHAPDLVVSCCSTRPGRR